MSATHPYIKNCLSVFFMLLLCVPIFGGCQKKTEPPTGNDTPTAAELRIAELEAEIASLKAQLYLYTVQISGTQPAPEQNEENAVFHYRVADQVAFITGYEGNATMIEIPATLNGYTVRGIDDRAFEGKALVSVALPEGITDIGWFAFYDCTQLLEISLPASVTSIGYAAFEGCSILRILCPANSYAASYAKSYGLKVTER